MTKTYIERPPRASQKSMPSHESLQEQAALQVLHKIFTVKKPMPHAHFYGLNFVIPCMKQKQTLKQYFGGDIQKFSEKLPSFIWSKYPKEKHLPSYNYLGPCTQLDIRLDENNLPKQGEEPINEIDRLAYIHDLAYQKSSNIQDRHKADLDMIEGLKGLQNLSFPHKLIKFMIIKLFKTKIKLGQGQRPRQLTLQGARAAKAQAIENLYKQPKIDSE